MARTLFGKTWWGEQWLKALSAIDFTNRLPRGASYARNGAVKSIKIDKNKITARVQGTHQYTVSIIVPKFSDKEINSLMDAITEYPAVLSALMNHELNPLILTLAQSVGVQLFPLSWKYFDMNCSCPDWAVPCKHIAAVIYLMSNEIDANPFLIFELHGLDFNKELAKRGYAINEQKQTISTLTQLVPLTTPTETTKERTIIPIDVTQLKPIGDLQLQLLSDNPAFYPYGDFKKVFKDGMAHIALWGKRLSTNPLWTSNIAEPSDKTIARDSKIEASIDNNGNYITMLDNNKIDTTILLDKLMEIDGDELYRYSSSVQAWHRVALVTFALMKNGAVIPQAYTNTKKEMCIRWVASPFDKTHIVEQCEQMFATGDMVYTSKQGRKTITQPVCNSAYEIISLILTTLIQETASSYTNSTPFQYLFFQNEPQAFDAPGLREVPSSIAIWLKRLEFYKVQYTPVFFVQEAPRNRFLMDIGILDYTSASNIFVPLKEILNQKRFEEKRIEILQTLSLLGAYIEKLSSYINAHGNNPLEYTTKTLPNLLFQTFPLMQLIGVEVILPKSLQSLARPAIRASISASNKSRFSLNDFFQFEWKLAIGDTLLSKDEFRTLMTQAGQLINFKGSYIFLESNDISRILNQLNDEPPSQSEIVRMALAGEHEGLPIELDSNMQHKLDLLRKQPAVAVSKDLNATLRPYQYDGYRWLYRNCKMGLGCIIADDMGLGKTLQVIALLLRLKSDGIVTKTSPALIVVPSALLFNWQQELNRFAPTLSHTLYHGSNRKWEKDYDIVLSSYGVVRSDVTKMKKHRFSIIVIDEAQNIKNVKTEQTKAIKSLKSNLHVAMSGTPVENRLSEFWSIMDYCNSGLLGSHKQFEEQFGKPIQLQNSQHAIDRFRKVTGPFLLRRLKTDKNIINDLPDKIEQNEYCSLSPQQTALYQEILNKAMRLIEAENGDNQQSLFKRQGLILQMILSLKQVCNHPAQYLKNKTTHTPDESNKTLMFLDLLSSIIENNEKALVFTQFKEMGTLLEEFVNSHLHEKTLFYHGGCTLKQRQQMVEQFQNDPSCRIFILSLKAAGTGLNLTAATHVIHYDLWWNPAVENQATDRAYRIGQHKNVQVHRFITRNTFEEKINTMIQDKKRIADLTVATGENWIGQLSNKELRDIFTLNKDEHNS